MATLKEIKERIAGVSSTQQITRAMKLVSTAKLQKIRAVTEANKPYFAIIRETVLDIMREAKAEGENPLSYLRCESEERDESGIGRKAFLLIASDRGLAGGYNANVGRLLISSDAYAEGSLIYTIGKKGRDFFRSRGIAVTEEVYDSADLSFREVESLAAHFLEEYRAGRFDELYVCYTNFKNTLTQRPELMKLLPFDADEDEKSTEIKPLMQYEPSAEEVLSELIPQYLTGLLYGAVVEARASEQGARMTAMDAATDNAQELIDTLDVSYNRARQYKITQEITEIINGASAN